MSIFRRFVKPSPMKVRPDETGVIGFALHANGRVDAIKQGSGIYGSGFGAAGFGDGAFSETAFGTQVALSQSGFGWAAAYSVSTWVYRCIEVRKSAVHRMPWNVYDKRTKQPLPDHPLAIALKRNRQRLLKKIEQSQLLYGETFLEFVHNDYGFTSDLFWLNNLGMAVLVGAGKILGYSYTAMQGGHAQNFDYDQVAFMKTDNPFNDLRGMSPTEVIMDEIAIDKDVARVVRAFYANDSRVGLLLIPKVNLQPADAERFLETWKKQTQGVNKAGKSILLPQDITVERVQEPATLDDVQLRESTRREIAAAYGVPLTLAGGWDDAKYQSLPEQRKSFYEETIIPECDNIAEFVNSDITPVMDDSGYAEFKFDYMSILALTEDAQKKNDIYSNRLVSGLITRAEAREALGHPVRDSDHVYYIPTGATVVPDDEIALVTPTTNTVDETPDQQQVAPTAGPDNGQQPKPETPPKQLPSGQTPGQNGGQNPPQNSAERKGSDSVLFSKDFLLSQIQHPAEPPVKSVPPPQGTSLDELNAWEKKALNNGATKAAGFVCYVLDKPMQDAVRGALNGAGKTATKAAIRTIFGEARKAMQPPAVMLDYWARHDALEAEIGRGWLNAYMVPVLETLLHGGIAPTDLELQAALDAVHPAFTDALLGDADTPGPLVKLILAGMAAGQEAIYNGSAANPQRPVQAKAALMIDWELLAHEARDFARQYVFNLIRNVDDTTRSQVREAVTKWIESGLPLDDLKAQLQQVFDDPARADLIAQTETTRAYAAGSLERYRRADVQMVKFVTVNDSHVCPTCAAYMGQVMPIDSGVVVPVHPGCRCYWRPVVED